MRSIDEILTVQRAYFKSGRTLPVENRIQSLRSLKQTLKRYEDRVCTALEQDLGKSRMEAYMCEIGMVYSEISYMLSHVKQLSRDRRVRTPLTQFPARSFRRPAPKGTVLIMSPWNYPLMLTLDPLVDALAAGNTAVVKPSAYAPHTAEILKIIVEEAFEPGLVSLVTGGRVENQRLLDQKFDHIFFTGSQSVGREVMRRAAEHLTPVTLELGGKSPCIVDGTGDLALAARRIVFGKFLNCGQTCVAPDYILCREDCQEELTTRLVEELHRQIGEEPMKNPDYGKIINEKHFTRILGLIDHDKVVTGGDAEANGLKLAPTIMKNCTWDMPVMQEEIFGPVLPILTYEDLEEAMDQINARPKPLALYLFSGDQGSIQRVLSGCRFGGGCINDTIIHLATDRMGFGGVGESGMGAYHGEEGFRTFTHFQSIVDKKCWLDLPMRYQPYGAGAEKLVRWLLR